MPFRRRLLGSPLLIAASALLLAVCSAAAQDQPAPHVPTSGEQFKNIKVLKDLPADQMIPVMHQISLSLGVQCTFCHEVETDAQGRHTGFEKDTKKAKDVARTMITMTRDLNAHQRMLDRKAT
jgi:PBP1b-binding outer membrane lipoprotein LpoB